MPEEKAADDNSRGVPGTDSDWDGVLERARAGDREALGLLAAQSRDYLLAIAHAELDEALRGKVAVSDVVQETLLTAQAAIGQFEGNNRNEFLAWMRGILKNDLRGVVRQYKGIQKRKVGRERAIDDSAEPRIDVASPNTDSIASREISAANNRSPDLRACAMRQES